MSSLLKPTRAPHAFHGKRAIAGSPEMKIFWVTLPFLITIFVITALQATLYYTALMGMLVCVIGAVILFYAASLARSNEEIKWERSELQSIVHNFRDALFVYTEDFTIRFVNPAAEHLFKIQSEAVVGKPLTPHAVNNPDTRLLAQVFFPSLAPLMISRSDPGVYPQIVDLSFDEIPLSLRVTTTPISDTTGRAFGFMKVIRDRTRDVSILKSKSEFITVASHQLRTPLTGIKWALSQLSEDSTIGDEGKTLIANTAEATREVLEIVESLLRVAKIEEGRFGYKFESLNLISFIDEILDVILPQARGLGVEVYFGRPEEPIVEVMADRQKLAMVFENLLDNAIRYNIKGGSVTLVVEKLKDRPYIQIGIRDTGIGIPKEDQERMFSKFYRSENALKHQATGSGLGLYIARNIIRAHGGEMRFESEVNRGSVFYFTLPTDPALVSHKETPIEY